MKSFILFCLLVSNTYALTSDEIKNLLKKEHDRSELIEELEIFPEGREFLSRVNITQPKKLGKQEGIISKEKTVDGKYIVTQTKIGSGENEVTLINVATYSADEGKYKMWTYLEKFDAIEEYDGIRLKNSNIITWYKVGKIKVGEQHGITVSSYEKNSVTWKEYRYTDGKVVFALEGIATKTK